MRVSWVAELLRPGRGAVQSGLEAVLTTVSPWEWLHLSWPGLLTCEGQGGVVAFRLSPSSPLLSPGTTTPLSRWERRGGAAASVVLIAKVRFP